MAIVSGENMSTLDFGGSFSSKSLSTGSEERLLLESPVLESASDGEDASREKPVPVPFNMILLEAVNGN